MRNKKNGTILIVDDEPLILHHIKEILTPQGYQILVANSGREALNLCEIAENRVDLLLTDVFMPGMKGNQLAKIFKTRIPGAKILYMSGYMCPAIPEEEQRDRLTSFIQKPITPNALSRKIKELLS